MNTGQLHNPQSQFATREVPTSHNMIQHDYTDQLHTSMLSKQGIVIQPHNRGTAPLLPFGGTMVFYLAMSHTHMDFIYMLGGEHTL